MSKVIKIKKGLRINLAGRAGKTIANMPPAAIYALKPSDFIGVVPKLLVKEGDEVKAGSPLFCDKAKPEILFTSPVSGTVKEILRGDRRKILSITVEPDGKGQYESFTRGAVNSLTRETIVENLLKSGLWPALKMRPYGIIARPKDKPKSIFISGMDSAPLGVDYNYIMQGLEREFQTGIDILSKLTDGKIHLGVDAKAETCTTFTGAQNIVLTSYQGPHPAGNVGTHIHKLDPINKGEVVWTLDPQQVVAIGRLFTEGRYDATRIIALTGSEVKNTGYFKMVSGAHLSTILANNVNGSNVRIIGGNVLTGNLLDADDFLGYYEPQITVIPEGNHYEFMGWIAPGLNRFSLSRTFFSWLTPNKEYIVDTNIKGGHRALMITGNFEKVFPFNILPMQLLKAIIIEDIDLMEQLGIYEVTEEDFALCEFIDTSKTEIQSIVRKGLDLMVKEMS